MDFGRFFFCVYVFNDSMDFPLEMEKCDSYTKMVYNNNDSITKISTRNHQMRGNDKCAA